MDALQPAISVSLSLTMASLNVLADERSADTHVYTEEPVDPDLSDNTADYRCASDQSGTARLQDDSILAIDSIPSTPAPAMPHPTPEPTVSLLYCR